MLTDDDREAILHAMAEEQRLKIEGKPYSEAVLLACEVALRVSRKRSAPHPLTGTWPETERRQDLEMRNARPKDSPYGKQQKPNSTQPSYWWNKDD